MLAFESAPDVARFCLSRAAALNCVKAVRRLSDMFMGGGRAAGRRLAGDVQEALGLLRNAGGGAQINVVNFGNTRPTGIVSFDDLPP